MAATRNPRNRLIHIRDEIEGLSAAVKGVTFEQYRDSYTLRRVTERALQIISEAARALPDELTARHSGGAVACDHWHRQYPPARIPTSRRSPSLGGRDRAFAATARSRPRHAGGI
jgi:hypothetical protein